MDSISKTQRSNNMFSIKSKNTKPELVFTLTFIDS